MSKRSAFEISNATVSTIKTADTGIPTTSTSKHKTTATEPSKEETDGPPTKRRSRSRLGCHRCKRLKVKCDELKPSCSLCVKANKPCDYSLKLTWGGRPFKDEKKSNLGFGTVMSFEMKYNPESSKSKKEEKKAGAKIVKEEVTANIPPLPIPTHITVNERTVTATRAPKGDNTILKSNLNSSAAAISSLEDGIFSKIDFSNITPMATNSPDWIPTRLSHYGQHLQQQFAPLERKIEEVFQPLDSDHIDLTPPTSAMSNSPSFHNGPNTTGLQQFDDFTAAFKDLDTPNVVAKHFVTDFLLPEFFEENNLVLNTKPSIHHGVDSNSDDSNTPPEQQIVVNSSFHTCNTPSASTPSIYKDLSHQLQEAFQNNNLNIRFRNYNTVTNYVPHDTQAIQQLLSPEILDYDSLFNYNIDHFISLPQQIHPLPDLLLKNPKYREYYHHYIHTFSKNFVPANASSYTDNPFTCLLPRLSMSSNNDGLLSALIAMCISQRYSRADADQSAFPKELVSDLLSRTLNDLYNRLTDPIEAQSDYTLGLILVMTCFDIIRGSSYTWRAHYHGARKIFTSRGFIKDVYDQKNSSSADKDKRLISFERGEESDLIFFFWRWFAYLDVFALLVSSSEIYATSPSRNLIKWSGPKVTRIEREALKDIDKLMGFDFKLLDFFAEIISLIDEREKNCQTSNNLTIDLMQRALDVKERLLTYIKDTDKERDEIELSIKLNPTDPRHVKLFDYSRLRATNNVFALSGVLQIYRRVLMMSTESDIVQNVVNEITLIIQEKIPENTPAANCTMFALFTAGCEAIDLEKRAFYIQRLTRLIEQGATGSRDAYNIMLDSWETRRFWADILSEKKIDIMFG